MTRIELKKKIALKFGSYHNFARLVGVQALKGKTPLEIDRIASGLARNGSKRGIPPRKLQLLKTNVMASEGGLEGFCEKHDFSAVSVYQILQGRRKRISPIVTRLFEHFGI